MKRKLLSFAILALGAALLAGCGNKTQAPANTTTKAPATTTQGGGSTTTQAPVVPENPMEGLNAGDLDYAYWWKLYIQRWNYLLPEIPLYSNEYYDFYDTNVLDKASVEANPTNPYWPATSAVIDWKPSASNPLKQIILGNSTQLSGMFRYSSFGVSSPGASNNAVQSMTSGLGTLETTPEGSYVWNETVVKDHKETMNEDGSKTYEIEINQGLKYSDGSDIKAKDYLYSTMYFASNIAHDKNFGNKATSGMSIVGWSTYAKYTGEEAAGTTKEFAGLRLLGDYKFSVTIDSSYLPYYYDLTYAAFSPSPKALWIGSENDVADEGDGVYITTSANAKTSKADSDATLKDSNGQTYEDVAFYAKDSDGKYVFGEHIISASKNTDEHYPYSGPFKVSSYNASTTQAILKKNAYFPGDYRGSKPEFETVVYVRVIDDTQLVQFTSGGVNVLESVTGGDATNEAIDASEKSNGRYAYIHYARAGYGKLGFRGDLGPASYVQVRQAIALTIDRAEFAKAFTGGYGGVVDGPYYPGSWSYKVVSYNGYDKSVISLDPYTNSIEDAIELLEEAGFVYGADGQAYTSGVRYVKLQGSYLNDDNIGYSSIDKAYSTVKVGDDYFMPLVINWFGTTENEFTDLLNSNWAGNTTMLNRLGMVVQHTFSEFTPMLGEFYQYAGYGYGGTPTYCAFNFATGYNSAIYDYSYNWSINPDYYDDYSVCYLKDEADYVDLVENADHSLAAYGEDHTDLYTLVGAQVKVTDVYEDENGMAHIYVKDILGENPTVVAKGTEGAVEYTLGMDFLSMAMVYNCSQAE